PVPPEPLFRGRVLLAGAPTRSAVYAIDGCTPMCPQSRRLQGAGEAPVHTSASCGAIGEDSSTRLAKQQNAKRDPTSPKSQRFHDRPSFHRWELPAAVARFRSPDLKSLLMARYPPTQCI